ncbi:MAG TPA: hypothetical protein PLR43_02365, partial [Syntrophales bacterium]|nr:hypothetical protein [Syntrophales bacterium]
MKPSITSCRALIYGLLFLVILPAGTLSAPAVSSGQEDRGVAVAPDEEKRSSIHEVDGYAYLSEDMTL